MKPEKHIEEVAIFVHGALAALHILSIIHNARKKNWFDVAAHGAATVYDGWAVIRHMQTLEDLDGTRQTSQ